MAQVLTAAGRAADEDQEALHMSAEQLRKMREDLDQYLMHWKRSAENIAMVRSLLRVTVVLLYPFIHPSIHPF